MAGSEHTPDPWQTDDNDISPGWLGRLFASYDPDGFYTRAMDEHGHRAQARVLSLPPFVLKAVGGIVRRVPEFDLNVQAFIRDAVFHHAARWAGRVGDYETIEAVTTALYIQQVEQRAAEDEQYRKLEGMLNRVAKDLAKGEQREWGEAQKGMVRSVPERWRERFLEGCERGSWG